jgi:hypothetical protein
MADRPLGIAARVRFASVLRLVPNYDYLLHNDRSEAEQGEKGAQHCQSYCGALRRNAIGGASVPLVPTESSIG